MQALSFFFNQITVRNSVTGISAFIYYLLSWLIKCKFLLTNFYPSDIGLSTTLRGLTDIFVAYFMYSEEPWHHEEPGWEGKEWICQQNWYSRKTI